MGCCKSRDGLFRRKTDEELLEVPEKYKEAFKNNDVKELTKMFSEQLETKIKGFDQMEKLQAELNDFKDGLLEEMKADTAAIRERMKARTEAAMSGLTEQHQEAMDRVG